jgi:cytidylate kinase
MKVVAIDGPAGSGKSSVAHHLGTSLGLTVLDTGAMYRTVTLAALERRVDLADADALTEIARTANMGFGDQVVTLDDRDVVLEIRGPEVTAAVSQVSAHPSVRAVLVERQRAWVREHGGGVVEGRDIATVVFPDAPVKIFLTASEEERARRRQRDEHGASRPIELADAKGQLNRRDQADSSLGRATRPEDAAPDAVVVDTTSMPMEEVVADLLERARAAFDGVDGVGGS